MLPADVMFFIINTVYSGARTHIRNAERSINQFHREGMKHLNGLLGMTKKSTICKILSVMLKCNMKCAQSIE